MRESQIKTLVLYAQYTTRLSYYDDWIDAFQEAPEFDATILNICRSQDPQQVGKTIKEYDAIILLHSTNGDTLEYIEPYRTILQDRKIPLLSFVGNEVNLPGSPISAKREFLKAIQADYIATQLLPEAGEYLFGDCSTKKVVSIPHALNPRVFKPERIHPAREVDVGVRSARYVAYLGDNDRNRLIERVVINGAERQLRLDIDTTKRLIRSGWAQFLNQCKGTVATEAGSWYLERDDHTVNAIRAWAVEHARKRGIVIPIDSPLRTIGHKLPWFLRAVLRKILRKGPVVHEANVSEKLNFEEVYEQFFKDKPRAPVYGKCISSRHFDAIGTKTCQIMIKGRFNNILAADVDYIPVSPDLSNIDEALRKFRDEDFRSAIVDQAYDHALNGHTYRHRTKQIAELLSTN